MIILVYSYDLWNVHFLKGVFLYCLNNNGVLDIPVVLHRMPSLGEVYQSVKEARKRFTVMITCRKSSRNSPLLQQLLTDVALLT